MSGQQITLTLHDEENQSELGYAVIVWPSGIDRPRVGEELRFGAYGAAFTVTEVGWFFDEDGDPELWVHAKAHVAASRMTREDVTYALKTSGLIKKEGA